MSTMSKLLILSVLLVGCASRPYCNGWCEPRSMPPQWAQTEEGQAYRKQMNARYDPWFPHAQARPQTSWTYHSSDPRPRRFRSDAEILRCTPLDPHAADCGGQSRLPGTEPPDTERGLNWEDLYDYGGDGHLEGRTP